MITYSTSSFSTPARSSAARIAIAPSSVACLSASEPPSLPNGVRTALTMTERLTKSRYQPPFAWVPARFSWVRGGRGQRSRGAYACGSSATRSSRRLRAATGAARRRRRRAAGGPRHRALAAPARRWWKDDGAARTGERDVDQAVERVRGLDRSPGLLGRRRAALH